MKIPNFIKSILLGVPIGVTFADTLGYVARVDGISMQPVFNPDQEVTDYVFLSHWAVRSHKVGRGDIISLKSPKDPEQRIIKRIVGLEGDIVATLGYKNDIVRIPEGHCWVEGDHTGHSMDSNNFGPVSIGLVTGKATFIVWPPSRWQSIKSHLTSVETMRTISLINHLEFDFNGSVVRKGVTLGDVDNDGNYELVVGNEDGEVVIFKALEKWQTITNLGFVSCVIVGDILNRNRNCLVIVTADGWCYIYAAGQTEILDSFDSKVDQQSEKHMNQMDGQAFPNEGNNSPKSDSLLEESKELEKTYLRRIHVQRIPPNTKDILLGDIDGDGLIEMVLGLTDRVVRSYRWCENDVIDASGDDKDDANSLGKLVALNKWECAQQIGSISLHHSLEGVPSLLVAQPGGTFMRIHHQPEEQTPQSQETSSLGDSGSLPSENLTGFSVDYQFLGISRMRNPNISSEILGDLKTIPNLNTSGESSQSPTEGDSKTHGIPYAVATLDGTIMLVQDEVILWAIAVDHQLFALTKLDVTGNGAEEIVVCSWDGHTYILDQYKNTVRFQLEESVQAFETGYYTLIPGNNPVTCFVYITFRNKILLYFDIPLKHMLSKKFEPSLSKLADIVEDVEDKQQYLENMDKRSKKDLVAYLLYGVKFDNLLD